MFGANVICGEEAQERGAGCGSFDCGAAVGFFAFHDADNSGDGHSGLTGGLNCVDRRSAGCADVVNDDDSGAFAAESFDAAPRAVSLFGFTNEEAVEEWSRWIRLRSPGACRCNVGDDGVSTHGEAAHSVRIDSFLIQQFENCVSGKATTLSVERGGPAVDIVIARAAGRELELTETKAGACKDREKLICVSRGGHQGDCKRAGNRDQGVGSNRLLV